MVLEELEKRRIPTRIACEHSRIGASKFGLRIRDSKPSDTGSRGYSDPMDVDAVNSLSSGKGKGSWSPRDGCFGAVEQNFNETAMHARAQASNRLLRAIRASHGPTVCPHSQAKVRVKKTRRKSEGKSKGIISSNQGAKGLQKSKTSKISLRGLENSKTETTFRNSGISIRLYH